MTSANRENFKMPSKEYFRGRLSAFKSVFAVLNHFNSSAMIEPKPVQKFVLDAIETLIYESTGDLERAPDAVLPSIDTMLRTVGEWLIEAADKKVE